MTEHQYGWDISGADIIVLSKVVFNRLMALDIWPFQDQIVVLSCNEPVLVPNHIANEIIHISQCSEPVQSRILRQGVALHNTMKEQSNHYLPDYYLGSIEEYGLRYQSADMVIDKQDLILTNIIPRLKESKQTFTVGFMLAQTGDV
ncbi:hypothetical protein C2869_08180 [Saccharobesus litoralis]|uniref:Uncharacterized protein n=2 Tax=Saccharobesus litoralis TaxID=2172099 RepID=A0A2S0VQC0_9ALTE|nr:hypothetical protein C2869_08180 [Saccharobesus litoralis]